MYTPKSENPLTSATLKANLMFWLKQHEKHLADANNAMEEARKCIDLLAAQEKAVV